MTLFKVYDEEAEVDISEDEKEDAAEHLNKDSDSEGSQDSEDQEDGNTKQ